MNRLLFFLSFSLLAACVQKPTSQDRSASQPTPVLRQFKKSVSGRFVFPLYTEGLTKPLLNASLVTLDTDGHLTALRSFESFYRRLWLFDLKPVAAGIYGYFTCFPSGDTCQTASYHFVGEHGQEVFLRPVPGEGSNLNFHDVLRAKNGNLFFLFSSFDLKTSAGESWVQEWNGKGEVVFDWRSRGKLKEIHPHGNTHDIFHFNSIDMDKDGNLLVSVMQFSEILKIAYPSGKILARIAAPEWKFENDPYGGFRFQHSVRALPNGNILLFDNGTGLDGRVSRAVEYRLNEKAKTATLVWEAKIPDQEDIRYRMIGGSVQRLSNGNTVIGWGLPKESSRPPQQSTLILSEIDSKGRVVRELRGPQLSYRIHFEEIAPPH